MAPLFEPYVADGDLALVSAPVDALGVNYYTVNAVRAVDGPVPLEVVPPAGYPLTGFGWAIAPDGLTEILVRLHRDHGDALPPLYVTENGRSGDDGLEDGDRIAYLGAHVDAVRAAVATGVDVRGFHVWTLMDNFEWAAGYTQRFGLVHVDFATQRRTPRASYGWYRDTIAAHARAGRDPTPRLSARISRGRRWRRPPASSRRPGRTAPGSRRAS